VGGVNVTGFQKEIKQVSRYQSLRTSKALENDPPPEIRADYGIWHEKRFKQWIMKEYSRKNTKIHRQN
jgi:hypothetical protein